MPGQNGGNEGGNGTGTATGQQKQAQADQGGIFELEEGDVQDQDKDTLKILKSRLVQFEDGAGVMGEVKNTGNQPFTFLRVRATLYDQNDDVLGEFFDNTEGESVGRLAPGEVWDFEITFEGADLGSAAKYSLSATGRKAGEAEGEGTAAGNETGGGTPTGTGQ